MSRATMIVVLGLTGPIGGVLGEVSAQPPARAMEERFEAEVRPVLVQTCFPCHGGKITPTRPATMPTTRSPSSPAIAITSSIR